MPLRLSRSLVLAGLCATLSAVAGATAHAGAAPAAARALDRMVAFLGGADLVYGLRTLTVAADARRDGDALVVPSRTAFAFPLHVRRDFVVADRPLALVSGPEGAQIVTRDGVARLSASERVAFERSTMRDPVALAKARLGRGVSVTLEGSETVEGVAVDLVRLRQVDHETVLAVATGDGRLVEIRYPLDARTTMTVRFDEWAVHAPGLRYPGRARGTVDGRPAFEVAVRRVEVDPPFDPLLFAIDDAADAPAARSLEAAR